MGLIALFSLFAAGASPAPSVQASLGQTFEIPLGEEAAIASERIVVGFAEVLQDSRCPTGVQCIAAGKAVVALRLTVADAPPVPVELATTQESAETDVGGYRIRLEGLDPYPTNGKSKAREKYVAKILITRL